MREQTFGRLNEPRQAPITRGALLGRLITALALLWVLLSAAWIAWQWEPRLLPVRSIGIEGEMHGLSRDALEQTISNEIKGGILSQDLSALRARIQALPWIARASVRRVWPDRIQVRVQEHHALARWGENGLVTESGVVFRPTDGRLPAGLARLSGPNDELAPQIVERFLDWGQRLLFLGLIVDAVHLDARGDWSLELLGGTAVMLGTEGVEARLERLIAAYSQIEAIGVPARLDLRYSNGLAVRWLPSATPPSAPKRVAAH